mgnify:CR=1 FL=1
MEKLTRNAIIGSKGFIGSALKRYADNYHQWEWVGVTRDNHADCNIVPYDTIIWVAGAASKRVSRETLIEDHIVGLLKVLRDFNYRKFVYVSSQAVYEDSAKYMTAHEDLVVKPEKLSNYAWVKYMGEKLVRANVNDWVIVRPNGFTGPGLKKNVVFDLMDKPPRLFVSPYSRIQYMHVDRFAEIMLEHVIKQNCKKLHVTAKDSITPPEIAQTLGIDFALVDIAKDAPMLTANMSVTKTEHLLNIQMPSCREAVLNWNRPLY